MRADAGMRRFLSFAFVDLNSQSLIGTARSRRWLLREGWHWQPGMRMVEAGCGPRETLDESPLVLHLRADASHVSCQFAVHAMPSQTCPPNASFSSLVQASVVRFCSAAFSSRKSDCRQSNGCR